MPRLHLTNKDRDDLVAQLADQVSRSVALTYSLDSDQAQIVYEQALEQISGEELEELRFFL